MVLVISIRAIIQLSQLAVSMENIKQCLLEHRTDGAPDTSFTALTLQSIPMILGISMDIIIMSINLHYTQGSVMTAGLGLSMILIHSLGGSLIIGFNGGCSNFASRSFGAQNRQLFNRYLIKGLVSLCILLTVFTLLGLSSEWMAILFGQDTEVAAYARDFYVYQLPGFYCMYIVGLVQSYLNAQSIYKPLQYMSLATVVLHFLLSYYISSSYGMMGIIISTNLTLFSQLLMILYIAVKYSTWYPSLEEFWNGSWTEGYGEYCIQCFYVGFPLYLDLFIYELLAVYVGSFKVLEQTTAHVAFTNIGLLLAAPMLGVSYTSMAKASQFIGRNDVQSLKKLAQRTLLLNFISVQGLYVMMWAYSHQIFSYYSQDPVVHEYMRASLVPYFVLNCFDSIQVMGSQMYKALEMGSWICKVFMVSYYLIAVGFTLLLGLIVELKSVCAWTGFACALAIIDACYIVRYSKLDLVKAVEKLHAAVSQQQQIEMVKV